MIDFDNASPGARLDDLGCALFLWLNIGTDGPDAAEQARRITIFCDACEIPTGAEVVGAIAAAVAASIERLHAEGRLADLEWWQAQPRGGTLSWLSVKGEEER